jgi:hypothetical protein
MTPVPPWVLRPGALATTALAPTSASAWGAGHFGEMNNKGGGYGGTPNPAATPTRMYRAPPWAAARLATPAAPPPCRNPAPPACPCRPRPRAASRRPAARKALAPGTREIRAPRPAPTLGATGGAGRAGDRLRHGALKREGDAGCGFQFATWFTVSRGRCTHGS